MSSQSTHQGSPISQSTRVDHGCSLTLTTLLHLTQTTLSMLSVWIVAPSTIHFTYLNYLSREPHEVRRHDVSGNDVPPRISGCVQKQRNVGKTDTSDFGAFSLTANVCGLLSSIKGRRSLYTTLKPTLFFDH